MTKKSAQILKDFLYSNKVTITEFAKVCEISRWSVYKYLSGENIHPKTAKKIETKILQTYRIFLPAEKLSR